LKYLAQKNCNVIENLEGVIGTIIELNRCNWSNFCCIYSKKSTDASRKIGRNSI